MNAHKNADVILSSGSFLKGNFYFKELLTEDPKQQEQASSEQEDTKMIDEEESKEDNDAYLKMKKQLQRYYL